MLEREPHGMEKLPFEAELPRPAVGRVAGDREVDRLEMDANLVGAPGFEGDA